MCSLSHCFFFLQENQSEMEKASKKRERNIKMFDQYIRNLRETDQRFSELRPQKSMTTSATTRVSASDLQSKNSTPLSAARLNLRRQHTVDAVCSGWWTGRPALNAMQEQLPHPRVAWESTLTMQVCHFSGVSAEAPQAAGSLAVTTEEEDTDVGRQESSQVGQVVAACTEQSENCYGSPDGFWEAEV